MVNYNIEKPSVSPKVGTEYYIADKEYKTNRIGKVTKIEDGNVHVTFSRVWEEDTKKELGFTKISPHSEVLKQSDYEFYNIKRRGGTRHRKNKRRITRRKRFT